MSDTYPTRAKDRSWLGYETGPRYTISAVNRTSSTLIATVATVHDMEEGLGSPDSNVHATRRCFFLSVTASFSLVVIAADPSELLKLFPIFAFVADVPAESCLAGAACSKG